jgi:hypothetical protein
MKKQLPVILLALVSAGLLAALISAKREIKKRGQKGVTH